jgi:hypothetical protein
MSKTSRKWTGLAFSYQDQKVVNKSSSWSELAFFCQGQMFLRKSRSWLRLAFSCQGQKFEKIKVMAKACLFVSRSEV